MTQHLNRASVAWEHIPQDKVRYQIQRERKVICFGNPGYVMEWDVVKEFETASKRDEALIKLQEKSSFEDHYRAHDYDPRLNRIMYG